MDRTTAGGLARGRVHEVFSLDASNASCAAAFTAMLALRLGGETIWLREQASIGKGGSLYLQGLAEIGLDPSRLIVGLLPDPLAVLGAAVAATRCPGVGVTIVELWLNPRLLDLTATRRLALAAEASGVTVLLLRLAGAPAPSAAQTRWTVQSAGSQPLEANAPGHPALDVELVRQRGRPAGVQWRVEWDREQRIFIDPSEQHQPIPGRGRRLGQPALPGVVVPFPEYGPAVAGNGSVPRRRTG